MEATLLGKVLVGGLAAIALLYLLMLRPWRPRRMWERRAPAVDLLFVVALATGVVAVSGAPPFQRIAEVLVEQTDLPETLGTIDDRIRAIETLPERIWEDLTARFGWSDEPPEPAPSDTGPGVVTSAVLPGVVAIVEVLVRAFVYWGSLISLAVCLVMRIVIGVKRAVGAAVARPRADPLLEGRVAELEEIVVTLRATRIELTAERGAASSGIIREP